MVWPHLQPLLDGVDVRLRPVTPADAGAVFRACQDPDIQHFTQVPVPYARRDAEAFVAGCAQRWVESLSACFAVCENRSGRFLGVVSVIGADHADGTAGFGYWTAPWGRGRGATSEAVRLAVAWAFSGGGLSQLTAEAELANPASMRVLEKAGFIRLAGADVVVELKGTARTFSIWRAEVPSPAEVAGLPR